MSGLLRPLVFAALGTLSAVSLLAPAEAQRGRGRDRDDERGGAIILYEHANYQGRSVRITEASSNLGHEGMNDMVSSIRIEGRGQWEICVHADYRGSCGVINEDQPDMTRNAMNDKMSSVRRVRFRGPDAEAGATLYAGPNFTGRSITLNSSSANLSGLAFNDMAGSIRVHRGSWVFCQHADFEGRCETFEGDVRSLARMGFEREISSAEPLDDYNYRRPGRSGPDYPSRPGRPGRPGGRVDVDGGTPTVYYERPSVDGQPVAFCSDRFGRTCGVEVANQLCRSAGHRRAMYHERSNYRGEAYFLQDDNFGRTEEILTNVLCNDR
ncbi:beta/gamma crystallin-related protein [Woodsholea maritima]|uniref:beta/gamma crystallin-related protein n=1 Tax=Woodsholea maritima TaxID=240237 RepID=UPI0003623FBE|nr:beta/gamma crystallin-related protein [Woodsholea maritima]